MHAHRKTQLFALSLSIGVLTAAQLSAQIPSAIAIPSLPVAAVFHAEGAQVYECTRASDGKLAWQAREPTATLIFDGNTIGRHYAGPRWEHVDGSTVRAKSVSSSPGATEDDIPWLRLDVVDQRGSGVFSGVTNVQRVNTQGGVSRGACDAAGRFRSVPYSADYVFLRG